MTYCLAIKTNEALVFVSDSRTNAGPDQVNTYSKTVRLFKNDQWQYCLLSAGNLATTQAVVTRIQRDLDEGNSPNLSTFRYIDEAAAYIGELSREEQSRHADAPVNAGFNAEASFILGGQLAGQPQEIFLIYPQGNYITCSGNAPFLQIGEIKYGKPILDRVIAPESSLMDTIRCALVSMDSTMRSNVTVGPPIELTIYINGQINQGCHVSLENDDPYLLQLNREWNQGLLNAFAGLTDIELPEKLGCLLKKIQ